MWQNVRAFLAGSGADFFATREGASRLLQLAGSLPSSSSSSSSSMLSHPTFIAYIGTATYDLATPAEKQLHAFQDFGCEVMPIALADTTKEKLASEEEYFLREKANIILVSGGNTSYAIRRWEETGLSDLLTEIILSRSSGKQENSSSSSSSAPSSRPLTIAGGSAGAICWCTSGHSDSADPSTYLAPSLLRASGQAEKIPAESTSTSWPFIRVHGLGIFPGMLCPHYDTTGGNGISREEDFSAILKRHVVERGVGIDHWAALLLNGDGTYDVWVMPEEARGRACTQKTRSDESAVGVYILDVAMETTTKNEKGNGTSTSGSTTGSNGVGSTVVTRSLVPSHGNVEDIFRPPSGPLIKDPFESFFGMANPTPSRSAFPKI